METVITGSNYQSSIRQNQNTGLSQTGESTFENTLQKTEEKSGGETVSAVENTEEPSKSDYVSRHEEEFIRDYPLYEKYKDVFIPRYSNYTREKANKVFEELEKKFPDFKMPDPFHATEEAKEAYDAQKKDYFAYAGELREKYDLEVTGMLLVTPEATKAFNYAIYEQLEQGKSVEDSLFEAVMVGMKFEGNEGLVFQARMFFGGSGNMDEMMAQQNQSSGEINYNEQIDLRSYGYRYDFLLEEYRRLFNYDRECVKHRIMDELEMFTFLTQNEEIVDREIEALQKRNPMNLRLRNDEDAEEFKKELQKSYEIVKLAKTVYDKYADKIFGNQSESSNQNLTGKSETFRYKIDIVVQQGGVANLQTSSGLSNALQAAG